MLSSKYKIRLDIPGQGPCEAKPCNDKIEWAWQFDDKYCVWRYVLKTELQFEKDIFEKIKVLEYDCNCYFIDVEIDRNCGNGFEEYQKGTIPWRGGAWNYRNCTLSTTLRIDDPLSCLLDEARFKIDLFACIDDRCDAKFYQGNIECFTCERNVDYFYTPPTIFNPDGNFFTNESECELPDNFAWTLTRQCVTDFFTQNGGFPENWLQRQVIIETYYREALNTTPTDTTGWTQIGTKWVRPIPVGPPTSTLEQLQVGECRTFGAIGLDSLFPIGVGFTTFGGPSFQVYRPNAINNGVSFSDVFEAFLKDCPYEICSNFFGINPDGTNPINNEYICAEKELWNLKAFHYSDVVYENADDVQGGQNASIFCKSFEDFFPNLKKLFINNLRMQYDPDADCLRVEHITYFQTKAAEPNRPRLNLLEDYKSCLPMEYTYKEELRPVVEKFQISNDESLDYNLEVIYDKRCSTTRQEFEERTETIDCISTNIRYLLNNEDLREQDQQGMVLVATDNNGVIINGVGCISNQLISNAPLAPANLFKKYGLQGRPQRIGQFNGEFMNFQSTAPVRCEGPIEIARSCDQWDSFSPNELVRTYFGNKGEYSKEVSYLDCGFDWNIQTITEICHRC